MTDGTQNPEPGTQNARPETQNTKPGTSNSMREILIEKVTVNIGVGAPGDKLEQAKTLLERLAVGRKPVETHARRRDPVFKLRKGLPIGTKVTLRGKEAKSFLDKALTAKRRVLRQSNFDKQGNFAFGVKEHIEMPGTKYVPELGIVGFDVIATMERPGFRVKRRRIKQSKVGKSHLVTKQEAIRFVRANFGTEIAGKSQ